MRQIVLDPTEDLPVQAGLTIVESEVGFLRLAVSTESLVVRGQYLCIWAEDFFGGRGIPVEHHISLAQELKSLFASFSPDELAALHQLLAPYGDNLRRPLSVTGILDVLVPTPLWQASPSRGHAAKWLLWLFQSKVASEVQALLAQVAEQWAHKADNSISNLYTIVTPEGAATRLLQWLGVKSPAVSEALGEFPHEVPGELVALAKQEWTRQATLTKGAFFAEVLARQMPFDIKCAAAEATAEYYSYQPQELTRAVVAMLSPHLEERMQRQLNQQLAPEIPAPLPSTATEVQAWFFKQYLPYRQWQSESVQKEPRAIVLAAAMEFVHWYLSQYPKALAGGELRNHLSFRRMLELEHDADVMTLVIVLDGLHVVDAAYLVRMIHQKIPRLTMVADECAFAPIPTVTEIAKSSLFRGVPPERVDDLPDIGVVLPESKTPVPHLGKPDEYKLYLWRVKDPDHTYHSNNHYEMLRHDVEAALAGVVAKMSEIVESVSQDTRLRLVITTDHGRLLARAERSIPVPAGMAGHGRAAWGDTTIPLAANGYVIEGEVAYLHRSSFGLRDHAAVVLSESSFLTNDGKTGSELYPHGGLFPEEVIIPWLVFMRDYVQPNVEVRLAGSARAGASGEAMVELRNFDIVGVVVREIILVAPGKRIHLPIEFMLGPRAVEHIRAQVDIWPTKAELKGITGHAKISLINGLEFELTTQQALESEEMYTRDDDDILEGLL